MIQTMDTFLDNITMYRLVLYILIFLTGLSALLGFLTILPYTGGSIIFSAVFLVLISWISNKWIAHIFEAPTNIESVYITALILALIIAPAQSMSDLPFLFWAAVLSTSSKYIFAIQKKHIFNPAAIAVVITGLARGESANWWVGTAWMMPFVTLSGILIVRKLQLEDLAWSFFVTAITVSLSITILKNGNLVTTMNQIAFHSSFIFLGSIMLTEPLTLPTKKRLQMIYGVIVGVLAVPQVHIGTIFFAPELALCIGNIFSYIVSPKNKLLLQLEQKLKITSDSMDFIFKTTQRFAFVPGQYMEWTLPHANTDSRGNRRYFTLASSPTEDVIRLGVKFYGNGSSYKKALYEMDERNIIVASQIAGEFTLPKNSAEKLVFIAGGIGITPFRSMLKYLVDIKEKRDIILFYTNKTIDEIAYTDVFTAAYTQLGIKTIYTITKTSSVPEGWNGKVGRLDKQMIEEEAPDFRERTFYLSGPHAMVSTYEQVLKNMGVKSNQIKTDFFPGLT